MNDANAQSIYTLQGMNAYNQITQYQQGNGITTTRTYSTDNLGFLKRITAGSVFDYEVSFDNKTGNLSSRTDHINTHTESFQYDNLNRLTTTNLDGNAGGSVGYTTNNNGNINTKSDAGTYVYCTDKPNAVCTIDDPTSNISTNQQDIIYNQFKKATQIAQGGYQLNITYGPDDERKKTVLTYPNNTQLTRYFTNNYEKTVSGNNTTEVNYINAGPGLVAMYVIQNGTGQMYYTHTDHLGSILTVTNQNAATVAEQSFDAWGRARHPGNWDYTSIPSVPDWLYRGYTGHEQLPSFTLVNMNGRMYDPVIARMLRPDNYVQLADNTQSYNRYSYALNNPLVYTDPNGEFIFTALALLIPGAQVFLPLALAIDIGGAFNVISHAGSYSGPNGFNSFITAYAIGGAAGAAGYFTGGAAFAALGGGAAIGAGGFLAGFGAGAVGSAVGSSVLSAGNNMYFGDPVMTPDEFSKTVLLGGLTGGLFNGIPAVLNGRKFLNGRFETPDLMVPKQINSIPSAPTNNELSTRTVTPVESTGTLPVTKTSEIGPLYRTTNAEGLKTTFQLNPFGDKKVIYNVTNISRAEFIAKIPGAMPSTSNPNLYLMSSGESFRLYTSSRGIPSIQYNGGNGFLRTLRFPK